MKKDNNQRSANRRSFINSLAVGAAAGITSLAPSVQAIAAEGAFNTELADDDPEAMFKNLKGKHRIVFDSPHPHEIFPFAWPRVFLLTNEATKVPAKDCDVIVVLRHASICYAMEDRLWAKYGFGKMFEANDPETKQPATRNPFWKPKAGAYKVPGVGEILIGINELQASGVKFCVCQAAIKVYSAVTAQTLNQKHEDVENDFLSGLLPGIQKVPSGVWALGRAQTNGCGYIFAG
jgi:intracellular sulfur oxidation DsrE/DsrF family protein